MWWNKRFTRTRWSGCILPFGIWARFTLWLGLWSFSWDITAYVFPISFQMTLEHQHYIWFWWNFRRCCLQSTNGTHEPSHDSVQLRRPHSIASNVNIFTKREIDLVSFPAHCAVKHVRLGTWVVIHAPGSCFSLHLVLLLQPSNIPQEAGFQLVGHILKDVGQTVVCSVILNNS